MEREIFRLATFVELPNLPENVNVSPLVLARHGFFYDAQRGTIKCTACYVEFGSLECSSSGILERHRVKSPRCCKFAHAASSPNIPRDLLGLTWPVGGHSAYSDGSQIGPDDIMTHILRSALARDTIKCVFQRHSGNNTEPSSSTSTPEENAEPQVLLIQ